MIEHFYCSAEIPRWLRVLQSTWRRFPGSLCLVPWARRARTATIPHPRRKARRKEVMSQGRQSGFRHRNQPPVDIVCLSAWPSFLVIYDRSGLNIFWHHIPSADIHVRTGSWVDKNTESYWSELLQTRTN